MENFNDTLTGKLKREIQELRSEVFFLRGEQSRDKISHNEDVEHIRAILLEAIAEDLDARVVINSVADVLGISLLREVAVNFNVNVEATMLVPADFDINHFDVTEVSMYPWNSEVEDFSIQSFEMGGLEEI